MKTSGEGDPVYITQSKPARPGPGGPPARPSQSLPTRASVLTPEEQEPWGTYVSFVDESEHDHGVAGEVGDPGGELPPGPAAPLQPPSRQGSPLRPPLAAVTTARTGGTKESTRMPEAGSWPADTQDTLGRSKLGALALRSSEAAHSHSIISCLVNKPQPC